MTPLIMFIYIIFICSISFVLGAWWCSVGQGNKTFEQEFAKEIAGHKKNNIKVCDHCGSLFDTEDSEDTVVCQTCVNYLKENPDDEYIQKWRYE